MIDVLAQYILKLSEAASKTRNADDRPLYGMYLADAAVLLALIISNAEDSLVFDAVKSHERLWGHTWLQDEAYKIPVAAFKAFKNELHTSYSD